MKKVSIFRIRNRLLIKNILFIYWHILGVILVLQSLILLGGILLAIIDNKPLWETVYLAFITALTIGYGDLTPESAAARVVAIFIGFVGIIFTGVIVAASLRALELTVKEQLAETDQD